MLEYKLVIEKIQDIEKKVNILIDDRWTPQGGVWVNINQPDEDGEDTEIMCFQAMIRERREEKSIYKTSQDILKEYSF